MWDADGRWLGGLLDTGGRWRCLLLWWWDRRRKWLNSGCILKMDRIYWQVGCGMLYKERSQDDSKALGLHSRIWGLHNRKMDFFSLGVYTPLLGCISFPQALHGNMIMHSGQHSDMDADSPEWSGSAASPVCKQGVEFYPASFVAPHEYSIAQEWRANVSWENDYIRREALLWKLVQLCTVGHWSHSGGSWRKGALGMNVAPFSGQNIDPVQCHLVGMVLFWFSALWLGQF